MFKIIKYFLIIFFGLVLTNVTLIELVKRKNKTDYIQLDLSLVNKEEIAYVEHITDSVVSVIQNGGYYKFSKRFNEYESVKKLEKSTQKYYQKLIASKYGDYKGIQLKAILKSKSENTFMNKIYRFKGIFDSNKDVEIRAFVNSKSEVIGTNVIPWKKKAFN